MTVKELIKQLQKLPEESIVILSKDAEGNGFSPVDEAGNCYYFPETTWSGMAFGNLKEAKEYGIKKDELQKAVIFWPVN